MTTEQTKSKTWNVLLWITQVLLALIFLPTGLMKIVQPESLPFPWIKDDPNLVLITGVVDLLGGIGIILPATLRIQPKLTIYAAYGIILLMISACIFHIARGEAKDIGFNIFVVVLAAFIVWGRQKKAPF